MQTLIKDKVDFKKVGYKNIRIFLKFLFERGMYDDYTTKFDSRFKNEENIIFAEGLLLFSLNDQWTKYLNDHNPTYKEENWKIIVDQMAEICPSVKISYDNDNKLHVKFNKEDIGCFKEVMISSEVGYNLAYTENNGIIDMHLKSKPWR